jgi:hypothetical protein
LFTHNMIGIRERSLDYFQQMDMNTAHLNSQAVDNQVTSL